MALLTLDRLRRPPVRAGRTLTISLVNNRCTAGGRQVATHSSSSRNCRSVFLSAASGMPARCPPVPTGKSETYPELPANYFHADLAAATQTVPEMARRDRDAAVRGVAALSAPVAGGGGEALFRQACAARR